MINSQALGHEACTHDALPGPIFYVDPLIGGSYQFAMELRHLRYFVMVAEQLHFGRAAERLAIAQPSLSQQIKNLEQELGVLLLERGTRHVALTEAGSAYLTEARLIIRQMEEARLVAQRAQRGEIGGLSLGFFALAALDTLPMLLSQFRQGHPDVLLKLHEMSNDEQARNVLAGSLDAGIVREPTVTGSLSMLRVFRDTQVVILPSSHRLAKRRTVHLADLRDEAFIIPPRSTGAAQYDRVIGACTAAGFSPRIVQDATFTTTVIGLVQAGLGVSIVPAIAAHIHSRAAVFRPLTPRIVVDTCIIWNADTFASKPVLMAFVNTARAVFAAGRPPPSGDQRRAGSGN